MFLNCKIRNSKRTIPAIFNCSSEALSGSQCGAATAPATSGAPALGHCPRQRKCPPFPAPPSPLRVRERESSRDSACPWRWAHFTEQCPHGAPALQAVSGGPQLSGPWPVPHCLAGPRLACPLARRRTPGLRPFLQPVTKLPGRAHEQLFETALSALWGTHWPPLPGTGRHLSLGYFLHKFVEFNSLI